MVCVPVATPHHHIYPAALPAMAASSSGVATGPIVEFEFGTRVCNFVKALNVYIVRFSFRIQMNMQPSLKWIRAAILGYRFKDILRIQTLTF